MRYSRSAHPLALEVVRVEVIQQDPYSDSDPKVFVLKHLVPPVLPAFLSLLAFGLPEFGRPFRVDAASR